MPTPFPGMDPYLEHPVLWPGAHLALMIEFRKQLAPRLRPRYAISVEERVFIDLPENQRVPDLWIRETQQPIRSRKRKPVGGVAMSIPAEGDIAQPVILETSTLESRERYLQILDLYREQRVVTVIELLSPANKRPGPGRRSYQQKQRATLRSQSHLVEIDLLRKGRHTLAIPKAALPPSIEYEYLAAVSRWPERKKFEVYPIRLRERLPRFAIPLSEPDQDVLLDLQAALEQVYEDSSYMLRVKYDEPCVPKLKADDQEWASQCWAEYRKSHPELFPSESA